MTLDLRPGRSWKSLEETYLGKPKRPGENFSKVLKDLKEAVCGSLKESKENIIRRLRKGDPFT